MVRLPEGKRLTSNANLPIRAKLVALLGNGDYVVANDDDVELYLKMAINNIVTSNVYGGFL